jgi:hypothetical protein
MRDAAPAPAGVRCGFRSKTSREVETMFEGPITFICIFLHAILAAFANQAAQNPAS